MFKVSTQYGDGNGTVSVDYFADKGVRNLLKDNKLDPKKYGFLGLKITYLSDHRTNEFITLFYFDKNEVGDTYDKRKKYYNKNGYLPVYEKSLKCSLQDLLGKYIKRLNILWSGFKTSTYEDFEIKVIEE